MQGSVVVPANFAIHGDAHALSDLIVSKVPFPWHLLVYTIEDTETPGAVDSRHLSDFVESKFKRYSGAAVSQCGHCRVAVDRTPYYT